MIENEVDSKVSETACKLPLQRIKPETAPWPHRTLALTHRSPVPIKVSGRRLHDTGVVDLNLNLKTFLRPEWSDWHVKLNLVNLTKIVRLASRACREKRSRRAVSSHKLNPFNQSHWPPSDCCRFKHTHRPTPRFATRNWNRAAIKNFLPLPLLENVFEHLADLFRWIQAVLPWGLTLPWGRDLLLLFNGIIRTGDAVGAEGGLVFLAF